MCRCVGGNIYECNDLAACYNGTVWGTGIFTGDSNIYKAAKQMGLLPGRFLKIDLPGMNNYFGTSTNNVVTNGYGNYGSSYCLVKAPEEKKEEKKEDFMKEMKELYES